MKQSAEIFYGIHPSPFGTYLLATIEGEVCALAFLEKGGEKEALKGLARDFRGATILRDQKKTEAIAKKIFTSSKQQRTVPLALYGTDFQVKVWDALLSIPEGKTLTYSDIAKKIGSPKAVRAVGTACGKNTIAYLIPCHRILAKNGRVGGYRWGIGRKKALLVSEGVLG